MTRVLIVDDHAAMRAGFRVILEASGFDVVGEAATGAEAADAVAEARPDVICMDVQMPDMDGIEATRRILARAAAEEAPAPRILIVTTFDRDDHLFAALDAGASGFLLKNAGPEQLVGAVRVVAAGDALLAPEVTRRVIERFAPAPASDHSDARIYGELTERETEVLRLLAQALSNAEIAQRLYIGEATVKTHVSNILLKLGVRDRVAAVVHAHRHGLA
ncbi:response regulator [Microbacterium sediminis]|uniref:DNA-binding response regulator n=2 Tax=Microbacterium sediminis TaxID=904291 RepID=A0A1B9N9S2_9MICO|nr:response regulator transcription factor [Microbacterium sediminis]OCG73336.1 DNA-binding response regulator [Microbacterium sediminis]QBR75235.1 response regulator transcription factor [Microbacterium sediminis]